MKWKVSWSDIGQYALMAAGLFLMAAAFNFFLIPNLIAPGGFTGLATIFYHLFSIPVGFCSLLLNLPLFLIAWRRSGVRFVGVSLGCTVLLSILLDCMPVAALTEDKLLSAVYGGVGLGAGLGIVLRAGGTTGGTDLLASLITAKGGRLSMGVVLMIIEVAIVGISGLTLGWSAALYSIVALGIQSFVIDLVQDGMRAGRAFLILSRERKAISDRVMKELSRGVTFLNGAGAYTGMDTQVLLCVVPMAQAHELKRIIHEEDSAAFIIVLDAREILGEGFYQEKLNGAKKKAGITK